MAKRGKGAIVNVSTMAADYAVSGLSLYGSSKAAINLLTKAWAAEYGPSGIRVNAVSPGPTRTEGTDAMGEGRSEEHTSELQSRLHLVCRLLLEKKKKNKTTKKSIDCK